MFDYMDYRTIESLPDDNADLPPAVRKLADQWRELEARAEQLDAEHVRAESAAKKAELVDAEALKTAVLAGKPIPADTAPDAAKVAERVKAALAIVVRERERIGAQLANELRKVDSRQWLAERAQSLAAKPLAAYRAAIDKAERQLSDAAETLRRATLLSGFVTELDNMVQPYGLQELHVTPVSLDNYRVDVRRVAEYVDNIGERPPAPRRLVRDRNDGSEIELDATTAYQFVRSGRFEFADGLPFNEQEAHRMPRPAGLPAVDAGESSGHTYAA